MAGLEQLEIHSKSYIVRWVKVDEGHTISWSVQPHKKSINFGIFKHPTANNENASSSPTAVVEDAPPYAASLQQAEPASRRPSSVRNDSSTAQEQLKAKGFIPVEWHGKCEAGKVSVGTYAVGPGKGGSYGLVFDNTFSKQISKTATFVLLTYPTDSPPHATHHLQQGGTASTSLTSRYSKASPSIAPSASESVESLQSSFAMGRHNSEGHSVMSRSGSVTGTAAYHVGVLQKRRRKKGQGYARRFFSLDFQSCTLSYYYNRNSSALRGAIPLSLAAIAADGRNREISIDSGAEIWHLKANNAKEFDEWTMALERASNAARGVSEGSNRRAPAGLKIRTAGLSQMSNNQEEEREWEQTEALVSRIVGVRDAVRRLSKDTRPGSSYHTARSGPGSTATLSEESADYFGNTVSEKKPSFWRRKSSAPMSAPSSVARGIPTHLNLPSPGTMNMTSADGTTTPTQCNPRKSHEETTMHDHCQSLFKDLDKIIEDFQILLSNSKRRRLPMSIPKSAISRDSIDTTSTGDFYDAEAGDQSQVMFVENQSDDEVEPSEAEEGIATDSSSITSKGMNEDSNDANTLFPIRPKNLEPLPITNVPNRRLTVPMPKMMPPSLIGFVRKNVGKDLSTIAMPVSANEPLSLLQRIAENLEYSSLLDTASEQKASSQRLLYVAAFAVSQFSSSRQRERSIRKPFNPMLGETYELVRGEKEVPGGFRLLVEKVSHRPVRMACQADSSQWSFSQSPAPSQKFWGKSAEIITEGRARITLRVPEGTDEHYSFSTATVFLRNIVMGEKYVEPVGTMTVMNETTGSKAVVEFKQKGMFGGRSEDVTVETYDAKGKHTGTGLTGNWTTHLRILEAGKSVGAEIWHVGDLVEKTAQRYGFTTFAATLNEITAVESGKLPPTDSRLRPDQRAAEEGRLDEAEQWKGMLETGQRARRAELEGRGEEHKPRWFTKVGVSDDGEEVWKLRAGKDGYWEERGRGEWKGVENILAVE